MPPSKVVPYRSPLVACTKPESGSAPSGHVSVLLAQKLCSVVRVPLGVISKTVPLKERPPFSVVPYRFPLVACTKTPCGCSPSGHGFWPQKLYSVVSSPLGVILNTVPPPKAPPFTVVPYRSPLVAWVKPANGCAPSGHPLSAQDRAVNSPPSVILKMVPPMLGLA